MTADPSLAHICSDENDDHIFSSQCAAGDPEQTLLVTEGCCHEECEHDDQRYNEKQNLIKEIIAPGVEVHSYEQAYQCSEYGKDGYMSKVPFSMMIILFQSVLIDFAPDRPITLLFRLIWWFNHLQNINASCHYRDTIRRITIPEN